MKFLKSAIIGIAAAAALSGVPTYATAQNSDTDYIIDLEWVCYFRPDGSLRKCQWEPAPKKP